jgi:predicted RNase H-like HicB family nuclease
MARKEPVTVHEYSYVALFRPEPEGGYTVTCPALPGLVTYGETLAEARAMAAEAVEAYLESLLKDGEPFPESDVSEPQAIAEPVRVKLERI